MARIPVVHENDPTLSKETRECLEDAARARGRLLNIYRAMANKPEAARAFTGLVNSVYRSGSTLKPKQAELAYLTATAVNNCYY